ncbi:hypothetical protein HMPREF2931_03140 [Fusobacterium sp. HMSC065F01]|uniref:hypothetical protein n=1 Tax=Fusobacterium sp. HMSC065F01 TaxID=1739435 RepID=UPI0008A630B9|nr:hypothetical protein [Fusobacterium sp. HMSC065F01]OFQ61537.1 hypothetical protein HMPREF2931_03140 [Fusobacterium sp. HMSC065F01]
MENLNLYYSREILNDQNLFALPIKEILIDVYIDRKKLNLYQEIILELYKCGCGNIKDIEEVLKLNNFHSEKSNNEDRESLIKYIIKELTKLEYIKDNDITEAGNNILEENLDDEKLLGSVFYNPFAKKYVNFLLINDLYKLEGNGKNLYKIELIEERGKREKINLGTPGKPDEIEVKFLDKRDLQKKSLDIDQFIEIIGKELRLLNNKVENLNTDIYSERQKKEFLEEKIEDLKKIRKFTEKMERDAYVLISLSGENKIRTSFEPELSDYKLREELKKEPLIAHLIEQNIDIENETSESENIETRIKYNIKEQEIIKDSNNKLKELPNLVRNLSNLSGLKEDRDNYKRNIKLIYESFGEVLLYLLGDTNLIKIKNKKMELERILKNNNYSDNLINTYLKFDERLSHIKDNKKLIDLISYLIITEERREDKKFQNYLKKNKNFLNFFKELIDKRNEFSHSEEENYDIIDLEENIEIEYYFESEARKKLYEFIEEIFNFKFKDSINFTTIDEDKENEIRKGSIKKINNKFSNVIISEVRNELLEIDIYYEYYKKYKSPVYKSLFMNRVAILLEKNMKLVKKDLDRILEIEDIKKYCKKDDKLEKIYLEEIEANFLKTNTENEWINNEFNKIKDIYILVTKVEGASRNFSKGTLNNNAVALLALKNKNSILEKLINNCLGFFKLVFIVSNFRGHNAVFHLKNEKNDREELEDVEAFLKTVYEIEKKVLKIVGGR